MTPDERQTILDRCRQSRRHNEAMRNLLSAAPSRSTRAQFARCAIDLAVEHHSALVRVVEAGEFGTGAALLRPILEAATIGYWLVYVASLEEVQALPTEPVDNPATDIPGLADMLKLLAPIFPDIQSLSTGLKRGGSATWLHKYTHGSTPQLNRRFEGGWSENEVLLTLVRADLFAVLAACLETALLTDSVIAPYAFGTRDELGLEGQVRFQFAPIPAQPHHLPPAPLLADG